MRTRTALVLLALALVCGCRRVDHDAIARARADLTGAWLRVPEDGEAPRESGEAAGDGFDLRDDGSVGLLGNDALAGVAWNRVRDELVLSTIGEHDPQPRTARLAITSLAGDALDLRGEDSDEFAGRYRRSPVARIDGVVTWLDPGALPSGARIEVRLARGGRLLARTRITPRASLPYPFTLSLLPAPAGEALALEASARAGGETLFATPAPVPAEPGASDVELLLRRSTAPR
jgi:hypothetical protein